MKFLESIFTHATIRGVISLPLCHAAGESALLFAARRGAMKKLSGDLVDVRAARTRAAVGELDRTLVIVESEELREGQMGRRPTVALAPKLTAQQRRAVKVFELARWIPSLVSCMATRARPDERS